MIAEFGQLDFMAFLLACGVPALIGLVVVYLVLVYGPATRDLLRFANPGPRIDADQTITLNRAMLTKAVVATIAVILIFVFVEERALWCLLIVAMLLLSRKLGTDQVLGRVDWHLLALFCGLFIVTGAMSGDDVIAGFFRDLLIGLRVDQPAVLLGVSLAGSNTIGNVPLVMMLLSLGPDWSRSMLHALAVFSTLSGNFLIVGSVANIIAVEQAAKAGTVISFADYARIGVPVTLISLGMALGWILLIA